MVRKNTQTELAFRLMTSEELVAALRILQREMPGDSERARGPKKSRDPFRACVSCILSAQSLDRNTAAAAQALFKLARTPEEVLRLSDTEIAQAIRPTGLYNRKTRNIRRFCEQLITEFDGQVPKTRDGLLSLHGIGRKCADLVAHFVFGLPYIAVDTHVRRVCQRTGLARGRVEAKVAQSLDKRAPDWAKPEAHFWLLHFGKAICQSRTPLCGQCPIYDYCQYSQKANSP